MVLVIVLGIIIGKGGWYWERRIWLERNISRSTPGRISQRGYYMPILKLYKNVTKIRRGWLSIEGTGNYRSSVYKWRWNRAKEASTFSASRVHRWRMIADAIIRKLTTQTYLVVFSKWFEVRTKISMKIFKILVNFKIDQIYLLRPIIFLADLLLFAILGHSFLGPFFLIIHCSISYVI